MSRTATRLLLLALACAVGVTIVLWLDRLRSPETPPVVTVRAATRAEPVTFNPLFANDLASAVAGRLLHATLVGIEHDTQELVPGLAETWTTSDDGRVVTLTLREHARFSDGRPVTAEDVRFSFAAAYDTRVKSPFADGLRVNGDPLGVRVVDPRTVELTYPAPFGPGLRPLHVLPILPAHVLAPALADGTLADAWSSLATPPGALVGAGPFVLERVEPGVAVHFARNPHAWQRDADGATLPRVDRLELRLMASQDAEMLQLASGELDIPTAELRPEDIPTTTRLSDDGALQTFDLGAALSADMLWFNLVPEAAATRDRPWLRERAFREAVAHATNREEFIAIVYQGSGEAVTSIITPGNRAWHASDVQPRPFSRERAAALLDGLGLVDRDGDGVRDDAAGRPARFSVLVQQGHTSRQRAMTVLQSMLQAVGLQMDVVPLDTQAIFARWGAGDYDAIYHVLAPSDTDPAGLDTFFLSSGPYHLWHPAQTTPATAWEAEIDRLFRAQLATTDQAERRRLVHELQRVFHRELPAIFFAAPRVHVAVAGRLTGVRPGLLTPPVLWNAAAIGVR
jgi:peptide/nickel transport system substrate-binding protein